LQHQVTPVDCHASIKQHTAHLLALNHTHLLRSVVSHGQLILGVKLAYSGGNGGPTIEKLPTRGAV